MPCMREPVPVARPLNSQHYPWYDSVWLSAYQRAKAIIRRFAPARLAPFEQAFAVFQTRPDFKVQVLERTFSAETLDEIRRTAAALAPAQLEMHEARVFRRFVVHDHPFFNQLQQQAVELVSQLAGEPLEASYNFLSLYGPMGVCPLHLDAPMAKWTLDLCLAQSAPWPIHFGPVAPWPEPGDYGENWEQQVKATLAGLSTSHSLLPGQALLFSGSSQWHYRDLMPGHGPKRFCDLLFFHFIPRGTSELVDPANWARLFDLAELAVDVQPPLSAASSAGR